MPGGGWGVVQIGPGRAGQVCFCWPRGTPDAHVQMSTVAATVEVCALWLAAALLVLQRGRWPGAAASCCTPAAQHGPLSSSWPTDSPLLLPPCPAPPPSGQAGQRQAGGGAAVGAAAGQHHQAAAQQAVRAHTEGQGGCSGTAESHESRHGAITACSVWGSIYWGSMILIRPLLILLPLSVPAPHPLFARLDAWTSIGLKRHAGSRPLSTAHPQHC